MRTRLTAILILGLSAHLQISAQTCQLVKEVWKPKNLQHLTRLLEHKADPNCRSNGETPLQAAIRSENLEAVEILLRFGADPNQRFKPNFKGESASPLQYFLDEQLYRYQKAERSNGQRGDSAKLEKIALLLLRNGAGATPKDRSGVTPLMLALAWGKPAVIEALLSRGAEPLDADSLGRTTLLYACWSRNLTIVRGLLALNSIDVNARSTGGDSALLAAAMSRSPAIVEALISAGADPNARKNEGANALVLAADQDDLETVQLLLKNHVDPNVSNEELLTLEFPGYFHQIMPSSAPLLAAAKTGNESMVRLLLESGAKARIYDEFGSRPRDFAALRERQYPTPDRSTVLKLLEEAEAREFALIPVSVLPERVALQAIQRAVGSGIMSNLAPRPEGKWLDPLVAKAIDTDASTMYWRWIPPDKSLGKPAGPSPIALSLTQNLYALEWALANADALGVQAVADDLNLKAENCRASAEGLGGEVKISVRTIQPDGNDRVALRVRYLEMYFWDLLKHAPELAKRWHEFASLTAINDEPVIAGKYMMIAYSADGRALSDPKPVFVSRTQPTKIQLALR